MVVLVCRSGFPGSQPVSMDRKNLQLLKRKPYRVSWKADGTRWALHVGSSGQFHIYCHTTAGISCTYDGKEKFSFWIEITLCSLAVSSPSRLVLQGNTYQTHCWMAYVCNHVPIICSLSLSSSLWQELVEDQLPNGIRRPRYLAYDIMQLCGQGDVARCDHGTRLQCIQREIMAPRDQAVSHECARLSCSTGCVSAGSAAKLYSN